MIFILLMLSIVGYLLLQVFGVDINEILGRKFEQDCAMKYGSENIKFAKCDVANHDQLKGM